MSTTEFFPATPNQEALWIFQDFHPESPAYNLAFALDFQGTLDEAALERAIGEVITHHEALRTHFAMRDGALQQVVLPAIRYSLNVCDLSGKGGEFLQTVSQREAGRPFQLEKGPLVRFLLLKSGVGVYRLLFVQHHAISDGFSTALVMEELAERYSALIEGRAPVIPAQEIDFPDYALWLQDQAESEVISADRDYWSRQLGNAPPPEPLPLPPPTPDSATPRGRWVHRQLSVAESEGLKALAEDEHATVFQIALAGVFVLLQRYTGTSDLAIGIPVENRPIADTAHLVGYLANTVVIRTEVGERDHFRSVLQAVRTRVWEAMQHQEWPFAEVVRMLKPERADRATPFFRVMLMQRQLHAGRLRFGVVEAAVETVDQAAAKFDLCFDLHEEAGRISLGLYYDAERFASWAAEEVLETLRTLLAAAVSTPHAPVATLPLLDSDAARNAVEVWGTGREAVAEPQTLHALVEQQARRRPDAVAVRGSGLQVTYAALDGRANALAARLVEAGVRVGDVVGVTAPRTPEAVIALFGVMKAGAAYLPLAPDDPAARSEQVLARAGAKALIVTAAEAPSAWPGLTFVVGKESLPSAPSVGGTPDDPAYVLYTSGSTGTPKGVVVSHRAVAAYLGWATSTYGLGESALVPVHTALSFDLTVTSLWGPLTTGGCLELIPEENAVEALAGALARTLVAEERYALLKLTPAHLQALEHLGGRHLPVDTLVVGGEALPAALVMRCFEASPGLRIINEYGPTEAAVGCCIHEVDPAAALSGSPSGSVPIGRPTPGTRLYVLDRYGAPVPRGLPGELYIAGVQLAEGYLHLPEQTAARFVPDSFRPTERAYRTGDLVRWNDGGVLEFIGRLDDQVKLNGYRIELGEVEAFLHAHPEVQAAVVLVRGDLNGGGLNEGRRLVAYVTCVSGPVPAEMELNLRRHMRERLPAYMIPTDIVAMEAFPMTPHGKVDRAALLQCAPEAARPDTVCIAPVTEAERMLVEIVEQVMGLKRVSVEADLFDLGVDSMRIFQISAKAQRMGLRVPPRLFISYPTIRAVAEAASGQAEASVHALYAERQGKADVAALLERVQEMSPEEVRALLTAKQTELKARL